MTALFPGQSLAADVSADLISAVIGALVVFIFRDHLMRGIHKWWRIHAAPDINREIHDKMNDMHRVVDELRLHLGNGYLDEVHVKLDGMEQKLRNIVTEEVVPLLITSQEE